MAGNILQRIFAPQGERRATIEDPSVPISSSGIMQWLGIGAPSASGINVTTDVALGVPAVLAAVNFLSGTMAGLPLHVYRKGKDGQRTRVNSVVSRMLQNSVNDEMSSFAWRKHGFEQTFTEGRSLTYIEKNGTGGAVNLFPLDMSMVAVKRKNNIKFYEYGSGKSKVTYAASEIIDIPFMLKSDMITHRGPIHTCRDAIGLSIAATKYGSKIFQNGGMPPFALQGPFQSGAAMTRGADDVAQAAVDAYTQGRHAVAIPMGHELKPLGFDPDKMQLVELQRWCVEQIARIYSIPPTFLQDLTNGTHSNTEQQDLHFVKHTVKRWCEQVEQELNLKLFGRNPRSGLYAEFALDGLLRGDFKTRMDGASTAIQNGMLTPNEARARENLPAKPNGNDLMIQGATVPLGSQPIKEPVSEPSNEPEE